MFYSIAIGISVGSIVTITVTLLFWAILDLAIKADIAGTLRNRHNLTSYKEIEKNILNMKRDK